MIGVISDTHGLVRPEVAAAFDGADLILHAGDVGHEDVLQQLGRIAPVVAVRGNVDRREGAASLPLRRTVQVGRHSVHVLHRLVDLDLDPAAAGIAAVVSGHSHAPSIEWLEGILLLNPGSAGPRRFRLPASVALLETDGDKLEPRLVELVPGGGPA